MSQNRPSRSRKQNEKAVERNEETEQMIEHNQTSAESENDSPDRH